MRATKSLELDGVQVQIIGGPLYTIAVQHACAFCTVCDFDFISWYNLVKLGIEDHKSTIKSTGNCNACRRGEDKMDCKD